MDCGSKRARRGATKQEELREEGARKREETTALDERVRRMRDDEGLTVDVIRSRTGLSKQAVYNALERARKARNVVRPPCPAQSGPGREAVPSAFGGKVLRVGAINLGWDEL